MSAFHLQIVTPDGSAFDGGDVTYTAVAADTRCKGNITLAVMTT